MAEIYRKSALEKLQNPDQLDRMITIISPSFWIAATGGGVILLVALVWSIFGRLAVKVETNGIYMNAGGMQTVYSTASGMVSEVAVQDGDTVKAGDILIKLDDEKLREQISSMENRRSKVYVVSFDSENDEASMDNKTLLDIKAQRIVGDAQLNANRALLETRQKELEEQDAATKKARAEFEAAQAAYFAGMDTPDTTSAQIAYQNTSSELSSARANLDSYRAQLAQSGTQINPLKEQRESVQDSRDTAAKKQKKAKNKAAEAMDQIEQIEAFDPESAGESSRASMVELLSGIGITVPGIITESGTQEYDWSYWDAGESGIKAQANSYLRSVYDQKSQEAAQYASQVESFDSTIDNLSASIDSASNSQNAYSSTVEEWYGRVSSAQYAYNEAEDAYISAMRDASAKQTQASRLSNAYNVAMNTYSTELSLRRNLEDSVIQLTVQVATGEENLEKQNAALKAQFDSAKAAALEQIDQELANLRAQQKDYTVRSTVGGRVSAVKAVVGEAVSQGAGICRLEGDSEAGNAVLSFVPAADARKIREGMKVIVYPSTVNRQEVGHMEGTVTEVDDYVTSQEELRNLLGDDTLVQQFVNNGAVVKVMTALREDPSTESGYYWSSRKGAKVMLEEGTIISTDTVTEEKAPITMLIPFLKEKLTVKVGQQQEG